MITPNRFSVITALVVLSASMDARAISLAPPPKLEQLAGAWIGPEESIAYFRLELNKAGRGILIIQKSYQPSSFSNYKITKTNLADNKISFVLMPLEGSDPTIALSGEAYSFGEMALVHSGVNKGFHWTYKVKLEREDYLLPRIRAVQNEGARMRAHAVH